ncbi:LPXTG cell wall anchor domain-containing protein [Enterococcus faecium]|nr:LPXTG cell wall anchor domain-containing protein [Enterococcus faecium]
MNKTVKMICFSGILLGVLVFNQPTMADSMADNSAETEIDIKLIRTPSPGKLPGNIIGGESVKQSNSPSYIASGDVKPKKKSFPKTGEKNTSFVLIGVLTTIITIFLFELTQKNRKEDDDVYN